MPDKKIIPAYNLYKELAAGLQFEFSRLEEAYNPYTGTAAHRHNYYEVLYFAKSGGTHELDFFSYPIESHAIHFISPGQVHLLRRYKNVTGYVLSFTKEFCYQRNIDIERFVFFNAPYSNSVIELKTIKSQKEILSHIREIQKEFTVNEPDKSDVLAAWLSIFLIKLNRLGTGMDTQNKRINKHLELAIQFKKLIEEHYRNIRSVAQYASLLHITPGHLNDTIQKYMGNTASDIIHERIILEAKRLLYHSDKSVKEICYELNYDDTSHFVKFFKTHSGCTPEQFRKQSREMYH